MILECQLVSYAQRLHDVSFATESGQLVGIIGGNGAGKTTLLHTLTAQLTPTRGKITFLGKDIGAASPLERRQMFGFLPQNPGVFSDVSVAHFLASGLVNLPAEKRGQAEVERVMQLLDLLDFRQRALAQLSGGEQRRVQFARALLGNQPLLLCDEPIASLDLGYQLQVMALLRELANAGKTVVVALHDLSLAARFCDSLLLLHKGAQVDFGEPAQVLTDTNLAQTFGIKARWLCTEQGVAMLPTLLKTSP